MFNKFIILILKYLILISGSEIFTIDKESGNIIVSKPIIDREVKDKYNLKIIATDRGNLSSESSLTIHVIDLNDNIPVFKHVTVYSKDKVRASASIKSNVSVTLGDHSIPHRLDNATTSVVIWLPETIPSGTPILSVQAVDIDTDKSMITYKLAKSVMEFAIHPVSGQLSVVGQLKIGEQELNITAEDDGGFMSWILIVVFVEEDILFEKK